MRTVTITFVCLHAVADGPPETRVTQMTDGAYGLVCQTCTRAARPFDYLQLDQPFDKEVSEEFWQASKTAIN